MISRSIFLLVNHYPYSTQENFLEDELPILARRFAHIYILPMCGGGKRRPVPDNCEVLSALNLTQNRMKYILRGLFSRKSFALLLYEFITNRVYLSRIKFHNWVSAGLQYNNLLHSSIVGHLISKLQPDDILYSYWGTDLIKLSLLTDNRCKVVSRFHGAWDLWEDTYENYFPLRSIIVNRLNVAVFISKKGEQYFNAKYPECKTLFHPLGSRDYGCPKRKGGSDTVRVVSCSTVYALKRVPLIFEALNYSGFARIHWTHLGGGQGLPQLKELVKKNKKEHLIVNLPGQMSHDEVINYYKENETDIFINLSESEGVPVSIMEAMSFNIPVLATNVGSTCEEVTSEVGELVSAMPTVEEISLTIAKMLKSYYTPRTYWEKHYNADVNYEKFAEMLANL